MTNPTPIRAVVGRNVRKHRERQAITAEELARRARAYGLNWSTSRVSDLENGRKAVSLAEMLVLAQALSLRALDVSLADLLAGADSVEITETFHITGQDLHRALTGGPVHLCPYGKDRRDARERNMARLNAANDRLQEAHEYLKLRDDWELTERAAEAATGAAENKAAKSLNVPRLVVEFAALDLWGRSLTEQRDAQVQPGSTAQARGHVTRTLVAELGRHIRKLHGDD